MQPAQIKGNPCGKGESEAGESPETPEYLPLTEPDISKPVIHTTSSTPTTETLDSGNDRDNTGHSTVNGSSAGTAGREPLRRYFSSSHSLPDYGAIDSSGNMKKLGSLLKGFSSFRPLNTLDSSGDPPAEQNPDTLRTSSRISSDLHSPKRQKTDPNGGYTESRLAPPADDARDNAPPASVAASAPRSRSTISNHDDRNPRNGIPEFQVLYDRLHGESRNRPRRRYRQMRSIPQSAKLFSVRNSSSRDPIVDASDDSISEQSGSGTAKHRSRPMAPNRAAGRQPFRDPADAEIIGSSKKALGSQPTKPASEANQAQGSKRRKTSDLDELSEDVVHTRSRVSTKTNANTSQNHAPKSSSISRRGDLTPSQFGTSTRNSAIVDGLEVKASLCLPGHTYFSARGAPEGDVADSRCVLRPVDGQPGSLVAFNLDGSRSTKFDWLRVDKHKTLRVHFSKECGFIKIAQSAMSEKSSGAVMLLEFFNPADAVQLTEWIGATDPRGCGRLESPETMSKFFKKAFEDVCKYLRQKASSRAPPPDEEVKLLEKREADRQHRTAPTQSPAEGPRSERRIVTRGLADQLPNSFETPEKPAPKSPRELNVEPPSGRRSLRRRTPNYTRSASPDRLKWTMLNPDWAENWRMPLSYRRTTIVKDDIHRLDDGECLNDNIIAFYLRYLFTELEASRPAVAKRLYFHNSYFYDKLKPNKGRGINYDSVKTWTAKVDLFSYDYIVVPVNEHSHWWVVIICNPAKMDPSTSSASDAQEDEAKGEADGKDGDEMEIEMEIRGSRGDRVTSQRSLDDPMDIDSDNSPRKTLTSSATTPRRMSIDGIEEIEDPTSARAVKRGGVEVIADSDDDNGGAQAGSTQGSSQNSKKPTKKKSAGPGPRKYDTKDPRIITLDSLGNGHSPACTNLKQYLIAEMKDKKNKVIDYPQPIGMKANNIPMQNNFSDCGVYLLGYIEEFLKDPDAFVHYLLRREQKEWDFDAWEKRNDLRKLIFGLHEEYQTGQEKLKGIRAEAKRMKVSSSPARGSQDAESKPRTTSEGGSRSVSAQPRESRPTSRSGLASPPAVIRPPKSDSTNGKGSLERSDTFNRTQASASKGAFLKQINIDGEAHVGRTTDQGRETYRQSKSASVSSAGLSSPLNLSKPMQSIEAPEQSRVITNRSRRHSPKSMSKKPSYTSKNIGLESSDDDKDKDEDKGSDEDDGDDEDEEEDEDKDADDANDDDDGINDSTLPKPILSFPPPAMSRARARAGEPLSSAGTRPRYSQARDGRGARPSSNDLYAVPSSPSPTAKGHEAGDDIQEQSTRSPFFSSYRATVSGNGHLRSLPRRGIPSNKGPIDTIDLTDDD